MTSAPQTFSPDHILAAGRPFLEQTNQGSTPYRIRPLYLPTTPCPPWTKRQNILLCFFPSPPLRANSFIHTFPLGSDHSLLLSNVTILLNSLFVPNYFSLWLPSPPTSSPHRPYHNLAQYHRSTESSAHRKRNRNQSLNHKLHQYQMRPQALSVQC